jgi:hypothetical protein
MRDPGDTAHEHLTADPFADPPLECVDILRGDSISLNRVPRTVLSAGE